MNKRAIALALIVLTFVGAGIYFLKKDNSSSNLNNSNVNNQINPNGTQPQDLTSIKKTDELPPPWINSKNPKEMTDQATLMKQQDNDVNAKSMANAADAKQKLANLEKIQSEIMAGMQSGQPDIKKLTATLHELKNTHGDIVGGVNINVLISNLEKTQQIQEISLAMQNETNKKVNLDQKKINEMMSKLRQLQSEMRTDFMVAPSTNIKK